ncbi:MAG: flagellar hook-basal body complex protein FliE [Bryobacteraceae bacterium]|nr:flagellar hook-basal body complex protein FliE [Bryobacteraceae bacterium]
MPINPIPGIRPPLPVETGGILPPAQAAPAPRPAASFQDLMSQSIAKVNGLHQNAQATALRFLQGEPVEIHQVALEQQRAAMAFDLLLEVRNKVVSAYQEVMRMPL